MPESPVIDLNADLGEGFGIWTFGGDAALLDVVTSANVACGFHAGDPPTMQRVCAAAAARNVNIGAQVGYRDLAGFGRRAIDVPPVELRAEVLYQMGALAAFAGTVGTQLRYVKPHGALYNRVVWDSDQASAVVAAVRAFDESLPVLGLPGSVFLRLAAQAGLPAVPEAFADRAYTPEGHLVPRTEPGAVISGEDEVCRRAVEIALHGRVEAVDGTVIPVAGRSLCLHSDTPGAVSLATSVRDALREAGVRMAAFG